VRTLISHPSLCYKLVPPLYLLGNCAPPKSNATNRIIHVSWHMWQFTRLMELVSDRAVMFLIATHTFVIDQFSSSAHCYNCHLFVDTCNRIQIEKNCFPVQSCSLSRESSSNSATLVRERTVWTERPPLVGEVSASFSGYRDAAWSVQQIPSALITVFQTGDVTFSFNGSSVVVTSLSGPRSRSATAQKIW
jgi:hypothetical protein